MPDEQSQKTGPAKGGQSSVKVWGGLLAVIVLVWVGWGAYTFWKASQIRVMRVKTKSGKIKRLVWKRPAYKKFRTFRAVVATARSRKQPIFLDLYADWCVPCKKLERETFSHPTVHPVLKKYLVVKFNIDKPEGRRLARRFRVRFYPTTLMLNSDGREVERVIGYYPARYYRPALVSVLEGRGFYTDLITRNRRNPNDLDVMIKLAERSILRRRIPQARRLYKHVWETDKQNKRGFGAMGLFGYARSFTRMNNYTKALPLLTTFFQLYKEQGKVHREALRLQIYALRRLRKNKEYRASLRMFRKMYPGADPTFK